MEQIKIFYWSFFVYYENYHVIGLQRTGTNWLHALIKENFNVKRRQNFWKHLTPLGQKSDYNNLHGPEHSNLILHEKIFYIVTDKNLEQWKKSISKRKVDFFVSHNFPDEENKNVEDIFYAWQKWKIENIDKNNFYYKNYNDWNNNWKEYLNEIKEITNWKTNHKNFVAVERRF